MALVTCRECKAQISTSAKACPQCGAKRSAGIGCGGIVLAGILLVSLATCISGGGSKDTPEGPPLTAAEQAAKDRRDRERGAVAMATKVLRQSMKDPKSFELERALFMQDGSGCYEFFGRNSFNARIRGSAVYTGSQLIQNSQGKAFTRAWNERCGGKSGEDITAYINMFVL